MNEGTRIRQVEIRVDRPAGRPSKKAKEAPLRLFKSVLLTLVMVGLIVSSGCSLFGGGKAKWTILAYMDGNCDLDLGNNGNSWSIGEVQELELVGSSDKVQVVAMVASLKTGGICKYYHIEHHEDELPDSLSSPVLENLGTKDMSDKTTLLNFIRYTTENYPAERYMLIIHNHGDGWRGVCLDEQNGAGQMMSMPNVRAALDTFHFDIIAFNACLMSMAEVAYEIKDHADYMVAGQPVLFAGNFGSDEWLRHLVDNPGSDPLDIAKKMVEAAYNSSNHRQFPGHMAVTDLSRIGTLAAKIASFGNLISKAMSSQLAGEVYHAFSETHKTENDDPAACDLREFCMKIKQEPTLKENPEVVSNANDVVSAINDAVPLTMTNEPGVPRGGLSIHLPWKLELFDSTNYVKCMFQATNWHAFLSKFIGNLGGGGGDVGAAYIQSDPEGATVWWDGTNTGAQTPVLITGAPAGQHQVKLTLDGYNDWTGTADVIANDTVTVSATMTQGGGGDECTVSGTVTWPGGTLTNFCKAALDTADTGGNLYVILETQVNPAGGAFQFQFAINADMLVAAEVWDDANGNQAFDAGDGWGFYDPDGDNQWTSNDLFTIGPDRQVTGVNIQLGTVTDADIPNFRRLDW